MKYCPVCEVTKSKSEFFKNRSKPDGLGAYCGLCSIIFQSKYSKSKEGKKKIKEYRASAHGKEVRHKCEKRYPQRKKARRAITYLVEMGKIKPAKELACNVCTRPAAEYHHHNGYASEYALDVIPLCIECHGKNKWRLARSDY